MSQTKENMKKPILGLILTHLAQILTQNFFRKLYLLLEVTHRSKLSSYAI